MNITGLNGVQEHHDFIPFRKLLDQYEPSSVQRVIDSSRVKQIADSIRQRQNLQGTFSFTIADVEGNSVLVDGQHRLVALREVMSSNPEVGDINVHVRRIPLDNMDKALHLVIELGRVHPVAPVETFEERRCLNEFTSWINSCINSPDRASKANNPYYGNYSKHIIENLSSNGFFGLFKDANKMIEKTKELNRWLYKNAIVIPRRNIADIKELASFICPDINRFSVSTFINFCQTYSGKRTNREIDEVFCLHLIVNYGFTEIISQMYSMDKTPEQIFELFRGGKLKFNYNTPIDNTTEKRVINDFFDGLDDKECPVCQRTVIVKKDRSTFALGHIKAHANGGYNEPNNLIPICHRCNLDCRAENLGAYCRRVFKRDDKYCIKVFREEK